MVVACAVACSCPAPAMVCPGFFPAASSSVYAGIQHLLVSIPSLLFLLFAPIIFLIWIGRRQNKPYFFFFKIKNNLGIFFLYFRLLLQQDELENFW